MKIVRGDILDDVDGLICIPVNVVGVMGAGLAKQWKEQHPERFELYAQACVSYKIREYTTLINWFWMLPTKGHWKDASDWSKIETRLKKDLQDIGTHTNYDTINLPKIGCGYGGLSWDDVLPKLVPILLDFEEHYEREAVIYV